MKKNILFVFVAAALAIAAFAVVPVLAQGADCVTEGNVTKCYLDVLPKLVGDGPFDLNQLTGLRVVPGFGDAVTVFVGRDDLVFARFAEFVGVTQPDGTADFYRIGACKDVPGNGGINKSCTYLGTVNLLGNGPFTFEQVTGVFFRDGVRYSIALDLRTTGSMYLYTGNAGTVSGFYQNQPAGLYYRVLR